MEKTVGFPGLWSISKLGNEMQLMKRKKFNGNNILMSLFGFDPETMTIRKEVIGGITTFLTISYILAVNPALLSQAGMDAFVQADYFNTKFTCP